MEARLLVLLESENTGMDEMNDELQVLGKILTP
jgi:hypothetical protein